MPLGKTHGRGPAAHHPASFGPEARKNPLPTRSAAKKRTFPLNTPEKQADGRVRRKAQRSMAQEPKQLTLIKKGQYYLFRYQPGDEGSLIQNLIDKAEDPHCALDWFD